ncbi:MAG TPA: hypothetical protein VN520_10875 [Streptomyces sp.]|uniref:hypothetical protein n=1 Tax=Streptomyces sp. TaxID=1931 RepID=UPI002CCE05D5|nr:hypothetical protein [Streptomyces sp.]HWU06868.1 hypothetical protein [Streptomyces sp.]
MRSGLLLRLIGRRYGTRDACGQVTREVLSGGAGPRVPEKGLGGLMPMDTQKTS